MDLDSETREETESKSSNGEVVKKDVIEVFREYAVQLDAKNDLYEKLVKKSRDITQESKKIIFMLHRIGELNKGKPVLEKAKKRLAEVYRTLTEDIGSLLISKDVFQYLRAFSPGLQEFVEALSFYYYLTFGKLLQIEEIHSATFLLDESETEKVQATGLPMSNILHFDDYVLGICDLTGELMRRCIASKCLDEPFRMRSILVEIIDSFQILRLKRKFNAVKSNLQKVEVACYYIQMRLAEVEYVLTSKGMVLSAELKESIFTSAFEDYDNSYVDNS